MLRIISSSINIEGRYIVREKGGEVKEDGALKLPASASPYR